MLPRPRTPRSGLSSRRAPRPRSRPIRPQPCGRRHRNALDWPTRVAPVLYYEHVELPTDKKDEAPQSGEGGGLTSMREESASAAPAGANEEVVNWGAVAMHAREAEAVKVKRAPVTVAVVDSGVEDTHPDLEGRVETSRSVKCSVNGVATQDFYG